MKSVGKHHNFSAGLLIGGRKDIDTEKEHVNDLNILVCTPGRLLQHMDETPNFDCSQLQVKITFLLISIYIFFPPPRHSILPVASSLYVVYGGKETILYRNMSYKRSHSYCLVHPPLPNHLGMQMKIST